MQPSQVGLRKNRHRGRSHRRRQTRYVISSPVATLHTGQLCS
ncbi:hypothetical protein CGRA01v4_08769 [Colletotrichum graminicola]|nr:hypothetical protein CGRA01v4_08769 [Colletotrichum graminicola]